MTTRTLHLALAACLIIAPIALDSQAVLAAPPASASTPTTAEHLQTAHATALRGVEMFTAYAVKAEAEGYPGAASLFRAAARSQQVDADVQMKVMAKLKVEAKPSTDTAPIEVLATKDNLTTSIAWVSEQRSKKLPAAMSTARTEGQREAENAFKYTREALTEISRFCRDLSDNLDGSRAGAKDYFVCRTCGYLVSTLDFQKCPVDYSTKDNFERVK